MVYQPHTYFISKDKVLHLYILYYPILCFIMFLVACSYFIYYSSKFLPISLEQISALKLHIVIYGSLSILTNKALSACGLFPQTIVQRPLFTKPFPNFGFKDIFSWPWSGIYKTRRWHEQAHLPQNSQSLLGFLPWLPFWCPLGLCHLLRARSDACSGTQPFIIWSLSVSPT